MRLIVLDLTYDLCPENLFEDSLLVLHTEQRFKFFPVVG